jgi:hypothetical protein
VTEALPPALPECRPAAGAADLYGGTAVMMMMMMMMRRRRRMVMMMMMMMMALTLAYVVEAELRVVAGQVQNNQVRQLMMIMMMM